MKNNKTVILFNGPPGCGKDFACINLNRDIKNSALDKFARFLKERTHALYGLDYDYTYYEDCKETPNSELMGLSPRQAYIEVAEKYFKPVHGPQVFGNILKKEINSSDKDIFFISDCGFIDEVQPLKDFNLLLIRIHRKGKDFKKDSRGYIYPLDINSIDIENKGDNSFIPELKKILGANYGWEFI